MSALFLLVYTAVMVLSLLIPSQTVLWLTLSVLFVTAAYLLGVWYPYLFTRAAQFWGYRWGFAPVLIFIAAAIWIEQKTAVLWILYAGTLTVGWMVPLIRYLAVRLRLYVVLRGKVSLGEILFGGQKSPLTVTLETADGMAVVGILGTPGTTRYCVEGDALISQPIRALSARVLGDVEESASRMEVTGKMLLLAGKETSVPYDAPETEDAYLFVHPHCLMLDEKGTAALGDRVGGFSLASSKTVRSVIRRGR